MPGWRPCGIAIGLHLCTEYVVNGQLNLPGTFIPRAWTWTRSAYSPLRRGGTLSLPVWTTLAVRNTVDMEKQKILKDFVLQVLRMRVPAVHDRHGNGPLEADGQEILAMWKPRPNPW